MRRIVVAVLAVGLALTVAGCGGGADEATTETPATPPPASAPAVEVPTVTDRSPVEFGEPEPFPSLEGTTVPETVASKLQSGRPLLLFFYDKDELETKTQRAEVDAVLSEYRGLIDLVSFDIGATKDGGATDAAKQAVALANGLRVTSTPYIIIVDGNGFITWRWLGYVDREIINKEVLRATE